jgi:hypothetical protein
MPRFALTALVVVAALIATSAASARVIENERFTSDAVYETCDLVPITGQWTVHELAQETVDANGETHYDTLLTTFFTGQDPSGNNYVSPAHQTYISQGDPGNPSVHTETFNWELIRTGRDGPADDLHEQAIFHFTFDANGRLTSFKFDFVDECT